MSSVERKLKELGIDLPAAPTPMGAYVPAMTVGSLVFISGQLPREGEKLICCGKAGKEVGVEDAKAAARLSCINAISVLKAEVGDLDRVKRIVRVTGHVASAPEFTNQPEVVNGASELLIEVFGPKGRHTRMATATPVLPGDATVAIELVAEVE